MSFKDKVALVTGGGSGIGRAAALAFARKGAKVSVADVAEPAAAETVRAIENLGGKAIAVTCDVSKGPDVQAMVQKTLSTFGSLEYAFNNAGVGIERSTVDCTEEEWDLTMNVNLKGVWLCMKHEIPAMTKPGGAIVNTASAAALVCISGHQPYTVSKYGVTAMTKVAALEWAASGLRINAVCPGPIRTPMLEPFLQDPLFQQFIQMSNPLGRVGTPEEVAEAVVWLCSADASYLTGIVLPVDGGTVAGIVRR